MENSEIVNDDICCIGNWIVNCYVINIIFNMKLINVIKSKLIRLKYSIGKNRIGVLGNHVSLPMKMIVGGVKILRYSMILI